MSHHFDTPTAREDPRVNLCDFYLFRRTPGTVTMVRTRFLGALRPASMLLVISQFDHLGTDRASSVWHAS
jgi:hypothetical protein